MRPLERCCIYSLRSPLFEFAIYLAPTPVLRVADMQDLLIAYHN